MPALRGYFFRPKPLPGDLFYMILFSINIIINNIIKNKINDNIEYLNGYSPKQCVCEVIVITKLKALVSNRTYKRLVHKTI